MVIVDWRYNLDIYFRAFLKYFDYKTVESDISDFKEHVQDEILKYNGDGLGEKTFRVNIVYKIFILYVHDVILR